MRWIENKIDRFCIAHPRFGIPNLMLYIAVANVAIGLIDNFSAGSLSEALFFSRSAIFSGEIWRIITFIFVPITGDYGILRFSIPGTSFLMTVISAYFYYQVGSMLERKWGTPRFNCFFFSGVFLNIMYGMIFGFASIAYINLSMFFSFAVLFPNTTILLNLIIPLKAKWAAWIDAALFVWDIFKYLQRGYIFLAFLPVIAILNFFLFFWSDIVDSFTSRKQRYQHQHSAQTINFKKAAKSAGAETGYVHKYPVRGKAYQEKGYIHKCAVCGKTDTDYPDMVFRYCSKCNGNYCYCEEHINNHTHIE